MGDNVVRRGLQEWARRARLGNMGLERTLAQIKRSTPIKNPLAERVSAAGFLGQWLSTNRKAGGADPRGTPTGADLVAMQVPLARAKAKHVAKPAKARGNLVYAHSRCPKGLTMQERHKEIKRLLEEFSTLPEDCGLPARVVGCVGARVDSRRRLPVWAISGEIRKPRLASTWRTWPKAHNFPQHPHSSAALALQAQRRHTSLVSASPASASPASASPASTSPAPASPAFASPAST